jgi:hypothetical protein
VILTDTLVPTDPLLSTQSGGTMSLASATIAQDTTPASKGLLSNASTVTLSIDTDGVIADSIWSVGPVSLRDRTSVAGNVTSGGAVTPINGAVVHGTTTQNTTVQTRTVTISVSFPSSSNNQTVATDLGNLAPGAYGTFTFNSGGAATFSAGTYFFQGLSFNSGSTMRINSSGGSIFIYVMSTLAFQRGTQTLVGGNANALRIVCFGAGTVFMQMAFTGTVVAPLATINFQGSSITYSGAFFGNSITGGPNLTYARNPFPSWTETPSNPMVVAPARLVASPVAPAPATKPAAPAPRPAVKHAEDPKPAASRARSKKKKK